MKRLLLLAAFGAVQFSAWAAAPEVLLIGHYSNMVQSGSEAPHFVSGYDVDLYAKKHRAFGTIAVAIGSEEPAVADLKNVVFDEATKQLSFDAAYSDGRDYSKGTGPDGRESRKVLHFAGSVAVKRVAGVVTIRDADCGGCKQVTKKVALKRSADTYVP